MNRTTEIYIDGRLVDVDKDTELTLEIRSNFFADITSIETNRTWTVKIPKTVRNLDIMGMPDRLGMTGRWARKYHTCEVRLNGIPLFEDGRATLEGCEDGIAMVIYWGVFAAIRRLQETDMKLNQLESDARVQFNRVNQPDDYGIFTELGYGYADYNEQQARSVVEGWTGYNAILTNKNPRRLELDEGKRVETGTETGERAALTQTEAEGWSSAVCAFPTGTTAVVKNLAGTGAYRAWAVVAEDATVLQIAEDNAQTERGGYLETEPVNVTGGTGVLILDNHTGGERIRSVSLWLDRESEARTVHVGYVTTGGEATAMAAGSVPKNWQGEYRLEQSWQKPEGTYVYAECSTQSVGIYWTSMARSGTCIGGTIAWDSGRQAMMRYIAEGGTPKLATWTVDAPVGAAYLLVNHKAEAGEDAEVTILETPTQTTQAWTQYKAIQPSVTLDWINRRIEDKLQLAITMPEALADEMKRIAVPLITQETDGETWQDTTLSLDVKDTTKEGIVNFTPTDLPAGLEVSSWTDNTGRTGSQMTATKDLKINIKISADVSFNTANLGFYDGGGGNMQTYTYGHYIRMAVEDSDYYVGGDGYKASVTDRLLIKEQDCTAGRYGTRIYGEGVVSVKSGDRIRLFIEHGNRFETDKEHENLRIENITVEGEVETDGEMPYGGWFPIAKNLPDIALTDYVKFLTLITGTFVKQGEGAGEIRLVPYKEVSTDKAVDWTGKLIPATGRNTPRSVKYTMDGWAQNNRYRWKDDDTVIFNHDGNITIDNETLEWERDVWELPFAASDADRVPIREPLTVKYTSDNGYVRQEISGYGYEQCEPRVMNVTAKAGKAALVFDIDLDRIFKERHKPLTDIIQDPHVITERFRLSDLDIMEFDETRPVYLQQYGQYFIVESLSVGADGVTEATMIQIND